jgi:hypothetical protein
MSREHVFNIFYVTKQSVRCYLFFTVATVCTSLQSVLLYGGWCNIYTARWDGLPQPVTEGRKGGTNPRAKLTRVPSGSNLHGAKKTSTSSTSYVYI